MDRSSGLRLLPDPHVRLFSEEPWHIALAQNQWLRSYLHLLARPVIVQSLAGLNSSLRDPWHVCLPLESSTISALRGILSSAQPERDDKNYSTFLDYLSFYLRVSHK